MSNLTNNTTALQELLSKANALPDAGGSSTTDTWTFTLEDGSTVIEKVAVSIPEGTVVKVTNAAGTVLWEKSSAARVAVHVSFSDAGGATDRFLGELGVLTVGGITISAAESDITLPAGTSTVTVEYKLTTALSNKRKVLVNGATVGNIQGENSPITTDIAVSDGDTITVRFVM